MTEEGSCSDVCNLSGGQSLEKRGGRGALLREQAHLGKSEFEGVSVITTFSDTAAPFFCVSV